MKKILLPLLLIASPVMAQGVPKTLTLPTDLVTQIVKYLGARPFEEVQPLMSAIQGCAQVQIPSQGGAIVSHGQCSEVTEYLAARNPPASAGTVPAPPAIAPGAAPVSHAPVQPPRLPQHLAPPRRP
jgi:hypothetical protein